LKQTYKSAQNEHKKNHIKSSGNALEGRLNPGQKALWLALQLVISAGDTDRLFDLPIREFLDLGFNAQLIERCLDGRKRNRLGIRFLMEEHLLVGIVFQGLIFPGRNQPGHQGHDGGNQ